MEINEFKSRLKSGNLSGAFLFAGEEDYLKKFYLASLGEAVAPDEALAPFNHIVFDGEKLNFAELSEAVKAPPMMSERKLVEWRYPNLNSLREEELSLLEELLLQREEYDYTTLAFIVTEDGLDLGAGKKKSSFVSRFEKKLNILRLDKSTDAQLISWIRRHFDFEGIKYEPSMPSALIFRSGHSMQLLKNEIEKLTAFAKANEKELTAADVELVATPTVECDTFAFSNAILNMDKQAAYTALMDMKARRVEPTVILGMTSRVITDLVNVSALIEEGRGFEDIKSILSMNEYKLKLYSSAAKKLARGRANAILAELMRVDTSMKYGGIGGYTAIELFVAANI